MLLQQLLHSVTTGGGHSMEAPTVITKRSPHAVNMDEKINYQRGHTSGILEGVSVTTVSKYYNSHL